MGGSTPSTPIVAPPLPRHGKPSGCCWSQSVVRRIEADRPVVSRRPAYLGLRLLGGLSLFTGLALVLAIVVMGLIALLYAAIGILLGAGLLYAAWRLR